LVGLQLGRAAGGRAADSISVKNVEAAAAKFSNATPKGITFANEKEIPWEQIVSVTIKCAIVIKAKNRPVMVLPAPVGITVSGTGPGASLVITGVPAPIQLTDLLTIEPKMPWMLQVSPKATLTSSTQTQRTYGGNLIFEVTRSPDGAAFQHQVTLLNLDANSSFTAKPGASPVHMHRYDGQFSERLYLLRRLYVAANAEGYHNSSLNLYLQQSYGGGVYGPVVDGDKSQLDFGVDMRYFAEHFYGAVPGVSFPGVLPREDYSITLGKIKGLPVVLGESARYMRPIQVDKAWQANGGINLSVPFTSTAKFTVSWFDDYLENAPNARKNYSTTTVGITLSLAGVR
jgi:hypothetical protein